MLTLSLALAWLATGFLVWLILFCLDEASTNYRRDIVMNMIVSPHHFLLTMLLWPLLLYAYVGQLKEGP
ncbi:MAG: hypothetical protein EOP83_32955 [Verrucomicrobiaceae bacterium]|nr:MAG: hypothetical protein EOP83_32955 [Verrucomicrobiaceae bacterium]